MSLHNSINDTQAQTLTTRGRSSEEGGKYLGFILYAIPLSWILIITSGFFFLTETGIIPLPPFFLNCFTIIIDHIEQALLDLSFFSIDFFNINLIQVYSGICPPASGMVRAHNLFL
ncbi:MAG: hypothetical protein JRI67_06315 [Deltaproteobacteria bacterium]|nr:hypothetical protein [Deltaproteobacteria bacterium]